MGAKAASPHQETGEEPVYEFERNNEGFRWDKFTEYMKEMDDELPEYVDWEEAGAVTPAMNQLQCEADYPYTGIAGPCQSKSLPVAARINGFFLVYVGGDERELMRAVAKQPVEVTICATGRFVDYSGNYTLEPKDFAIGEGTEYNHSVLLVGYGVDENGPYWKIKNSWGPGWGKRGFAKLRRGVKDPNGTGGMTRPGAFVFFPVME